MEFRVSCVIVLIWSQIHNVVCDVNFIFKKESSIAYTLIEELSLSKSNLDCSSSSQNVLDGLKDGSFMEYSFRMMDSSGHFGSGLLNGNPHILGDYDECVSIRTNDGFRGQFIVALSPYQLNSAKNLIAWKQFISAYKNIDVLSMSDARRHKDYGFPWNETFSKGRNNFIMQDLIEGFVLQKPVLGLCVPSTCDTKTLQTALTNTITKFIKYITDNKVETSPVKYYLTNLNYIQEDSIKFTAGDIFALTVIIIFGLCTALGTFIDAFLEHDSRAFFKILVCFSMIRNSQNLLDTQGANKGVGVLNSLRFLSIVWIIFGHTWYIYTSMQQPSNLFDMTDFYGDWIFFPLFGAASYPSVDTFFVIGGFLTAFVTLNKLDKSRGGLSFFQALIHRYIRLTPVYAFLILFCSTLILYLGEGPFWNFMLEPTENCHHYWWTNLLYINNYVKPDFNCMRPAWYLACDFQLYFLGIFVMWILWHYETIGRMILVLLLFISSFIPGALTYAREWGPVNTVSFRAPHWGNYFYQMTYTRASPYIYGMIFGYLLHKYKSTEIRLNKWQQIAGWSLSMLTGLSVVYGFIDKWTLSLHCTDNRGCFSVSESVVFASLGRLCWGISISWIIFACYTGYGGIINKLLSHPIFLPLNRLGYVLYLVHFNVIVVFLFSRKEIFRFDMATMVYHFFGHTGVSLIISFVVSLIFESPFYGIERILCETLKTNKKQS